MPESMYYSLLPSPIGELLLVSDGSSLTTMHMPAPGRKLHIHPDWQRDDSCLRTVREQLTEYFAGERTTFDLPLAPEGTSFQRRVWAELCRIPYGTTISYAELARRVGQPGAARAVGAANGRNPIGIIVPCHRVIGADGTLTGFGAGINRKRWLLKHEAKVLSTVSTDGVDESELIARASC